MLILIYDIHSAFENGLARKCEVCGDTICATSHLRRSVALKRASCSTFQDSVCSTHRHETARSETSGSPIFSLAFCSHRPRFSVS